MDLAVTNTSNTPNSTSLSQTLTNGSVTAGQNFNFTFWAMQISSGVSYVQNYRLSWLNSSGGTVGTVGWNGFSGTYGSWNQITATNLVVPAGTVNAQIQISGTTGAVQSGYGEVLVDDVVLATNTPPQTNIIATVVQPAVQIGWSSTAGKNYDVSWTPNLAGNTWSNLATSVPGNGTTNIVSDVISSNQVRFYRVVQLP